MSITHVRREMKKGLLLLTGGSGMVGRNLIEYNKDNSWDILAPSSSELNLTDADATLEYVQSVAPDVIIHAAGRVGGIQANIAAPVDFLVTNMDLGRNIVLAGYHAGVKRLLNLGSSCMYPRDAINPLSEDMILSGSLEPTNEGYALAKIMTARLCQYINQQDSAYQYKTLVPCNIYGCYDKFDPQHSHLIPSIIHKLHQAIIASCNTVEIWGDGEARREFMYAGDLADAVFYMLDHYEDCPDLINIGMGEDYTINQYYEKVAAIVGYEGNFKHNMDRPVGMRQKLLSVIRQTDIGWRPRVDLYNGVKKTYEYYTVYQS